MTKSSLRYVPLLVEICRRRLHQISMQDADVIVDFEKALANQRINLYLQPKYSIKDQRVIGAEVLSRIEDGQGCIMSPAVYVPILERVGLISDLDYEVVKATVALLKKWKLEGKTLLPISINLSRLDLLEPDFIDKIDKLVALSGVDRKYIEFELTETFWVQDLEFVVEKLLDLKQKGYRIALDDFGAGYNSLYALSKLPADVIKFDRGFVLHSIQNESGLIILSNLVHTFQEVDFEVLCEGIETEAELHKIVACGCEIIQGFFYDKPLDISTFESKYVNV